MPDRRVLTIDVGNTSAKGVLWCEGVMRFCFRYRHDQPLASELAAGLGRVDMLVGVAVPGRELTLPIGCDQEQWVGREIAVPGEVRYDEPSEMGNDRRVTCFGALRDFGPSLVIDCGTAVTLTHVDTEAVVRGLAIGAGYGCLRRALGDAAPALASRLGGSPPAEGRVARSTAENLAVGVDVGWAGSVRALLKDAEARLQGEGVELGRVVVTGSDAARAVAAIEGSVEAACLVHSGLFELANERWRTRGC